MFGIERGPGEGQVGITLQYSTASVKPDRSGPVDTVAEDCTNSRLSGPICDFCCCRRRDNLEMKSMETDP
jgi:hypothetical protein